MRASATSDISIAILRCYFIPPVLKYTSPTGPVEYSHTPAAVVDSYLQDKVREYSSPARQKLTSNWRSNVYFKYQGV
jgi:hypothetical protein